MGDWAWEMFQGFCLMIDKMIYGINVLLFELFLGVSNARFPNSIFENFLENIYVVIGIFMLFRVAFSLIQMLANPDMMGDKEKGAGKIATRVVIVFALIIMIPSIFDMAFNLQSAIISDNIIGQLVLGKSDNGKSNSIKDQGKLISISVFKAMISPNAKVDTNGANSDCFVALNDHNNYPTIESLEDIDGAGKNCFTTKENNNYIYEYRPLVSSLATGMVAWLMVGFCIDIGVRLVKLTFLQLIAPVCVVTYVGGGKDNAFNKWMKMTISSYVSVFVKLIVIYFIIYIASAISNNLDKIGLNDVAGGLGYVAVILGLLVFAKNAPKLIGDLFGVKMDEESGFKGLAKTALLGGAALAVGGGTAGVGSAISKFAASRQAGNGFWKSLGAGTTGFLSGAAAGAYSGAKGKNVLKAATGGVGIAQKKGQQTFNQGQTHWWERTGAKISGGLGLQTEGQHMKSNLDALNQYAKGRESIKSIAESDKNSRSYLASIGGLGYTKVNDFKEAYERAVNSGMSEAEIMLRKQQWDDATNMAIDRDMRDANTSIGAISANMNRLMVDNSEAFGGMNAPTNASELSANYGEVKNRSTVLEQSEAYKRATDIDKATQKSGK